MRRARLNFMCLLACSILAPALMLAQLPKRAKEKPGKLSGVVVTAKGAPVAGAQILWQDSDGRLPHVLHSDVHGRFSIPELRAGLYDLRAAAHGTWSEWEHNVMVRPGREADVTLRLSFKAQPPAAVVELKGAMRTWDVPVSGAAAHDSAVDPKGNIWFTLQETGHIARFNPVTHQWDLFKVPTPHSGPDGLVSDAEGNIWFMENYNLGERWRAVVLRVDRGKAGPRKSE